MAVFALVTDGIKTAALLGDKCIGAGVNKISVLVTAAEDAEINIEISSLRNFRLEGKEKFYELAKTIASLDIKDATAP